MANLKCKECKKFFPKEELISYGPRGGYQFNYCNDCYTKKRKREQFADYICNLFKLRAPGPMIYSQRKKLNEQGFTDEVILMTLKYLYEVRGYDSSLANLSLVNLTSIEEAKDYFSTKDLSEKTIAEKVHNQKIETQYVSIQKIEQKKKQDNQNDLNSLLEEW